MVTAVESVGTGGKASMGDFLEWEENIHQLPFYKHMIAGSLAGLTEHTLLFPLDTIRVTPIQTNLQANSSSSLSISATFRALYKDAGFSRMWRGIESVILGCIPAHAAFFSIYEYSKRSFHIEMDSHLYFFSTFFTGGVATLAHDAIITPMDVIKQRIQLNGKVGPLIMCRKLVREEGVISLYRSLPVTLLMNIPFSGLLVTINENLKSYFLGEHYEGMLGYFICAAIAGSVSAALTTPLDVIKTRMQTQHETSSISTVKSLKVKNKLRYLSIKNTVQDIWSNEGLRGFAKGAVPRSLFFLPSSAVSWATYEYIKQLLASHE